MKREKSYELTVEVNRQQKSPSACGNAELHKRKGPTDWVHPPLIPSTTQWVKFTLNKLKITYTKRYSPFIYPLFLFPFSFSFFKLNKILFPRFCYQISSLDPHESFTKKTSKINFPKIRNILRRSGVAFALLNNMK